MNTRMKKHPTRPFPHSVMGLTLIEILVALVIGLLLIGGAFSLFINNKRVFNENQQTGRLQESARIAIELLTNDIRRAGFIGCHHDITQVTNTINTTHASYDALFAISNVNASFAIEGLVSGTSTAVWQPSGINESATGTGIGQRIAGADAITIRYLSGEFWDVVRDNDPNSGTVQGFMAATNSPLVVSTVDGHPNIGDRANNLVRGELVAVSDCTSTHLFQIGSGCASAESVAVIPTCTSADGLVGVTGAQIVPGNNPADLGRVYAENARVRRYIAARYYIANGSYGGPSLFRQTIRNSTVDAAGNPLANPTLVAQAQELVEGIENMQILYGVDDVGGVHDGVPDNYLAANAVALANWGDVVSVRIALLLRSIDQNFADNPDEEKYDLLGTIMDPANLKVRRRVFTTTIQIKNRINDGVG